MLKEIIGKKLGMTQIFDAKSNLIGVTLIEVEPVCILEKVEYPNKVKAKIGCFKVATYRLPTLQKPVIGYFKKIGVEPYRVIREVSVDNDIDFSAILSKELENRPQEANQETAQSPEAVKEEKKDAITKPKRYIGVEIFTEGEVVDVQGRTKGRGFAGGMKRWGWHGQPAAHGSMSHRRIGSNGSNTDPGRVIKGIGMPGHMGDALCTSRKIKIIKIDHDKQLLFITGSIPGSKGSVVKIRKVK